ncbi:MAG: circadian clock protein KaiA [Elainella sp.]
MQSSFSICLLCSVLLFEKLLGPALDGTGVELNQSALNLSVGSTSSAPRPNYRCQQFDHPEQLWQYLQQGHPVDCLVLQARSDLQPLLDQLQQQRFFFPCVILNWPESRLTEADPANLANLDLAELDLAELGPADPDPGNLDSARSDLAKSDLAKPDLANPVSEFGPFVYHEAVALLPWEKSGQIRFAIAQAISQFVHLEPAPATTPESANSLDSLMTQQLRLADKLKERLDYLGVYYKRNPQQFLRHMSPPEREDLLRQLELEYRDIVLVYFSEESRLNAMIDQFVNLAFFADVPISQIVQIHMDLMDEFSKHLKMEGRSEEVLLDYRLTLIDTLAHLCEMYRRSIPRES